MLRRVFVAAFFSALLILPGPRPAAAADDAAALIAKHAAYAGWHAGDGVVKTLRETGGSTRDGTLRTALTSLRYGVAFRDSVLTPNGLRADSGFTGSVSWTSNENGFTVRPAGEVLRYLYDVDALFGETTATDAFVPTIVRSETIEGSACSVVRLISPVGFPMDVCIDPATGAYRRAVIDPDGKYETSFDGLEYTAVDGKRFLSAWHHGKSNIRYRYATIVPNATVDPDDLRPPKQTATWTFGDAPAAVEYVELPYPRIYVDVIVNGVKGKFIFDTGAASTAMLDSFARRAGAKRFGETGISGIGGSAKANLFRADTIAVGGSVLHDVIVSSGLDEQDFASMGVVGIIGFDLLAATVADLNFDTKTLKLMDPAQVAPSAGIGLPLRVDLSDGFLRVPMRIDDRIDVIATLDSGNPSDVLFSADLIGRDHLHFTPTSSQRGYGIAGSEIELCGRLQSISLGPVRYTTPIACSSPSFERNEILMGLDFMRAFNFVFDYPDGIVVMVQRKHY